MVDDEKFARAQQFVADHQRADGIVAGAASGVADHVRVALGEAGVLGGIKPGVHAGKNRKATGRREGQLAFFSEVGGILAIGLEHFRQNLAHGILL